MEDAKAEARHRGQVPRVAADDRLREEHQPVRRRRLRHHRDRRLPARRRHEGRGRGEPGHRGSRSSTSPTTRPPERRGPRLHDRTRPPCSSATSSAGMSKSGIMGTFGGINIGGGVTDFMDGFVAGANYYNKETGTASRVLGWDAVKKEGSFTGDFDSTRQRQGPDRPDAPGRRGRHPAGRRPDRRRRVRRRSRSRRPRTTASASTSTGASRRPQYCDVLLTSVLKKIDVVRHGGRRARRQRRDAAARLRQHARQRRRRTSAPFNEFDAAVPQALKDGVAALKAEIISGEVKVADYFAPVASATERHRTSDGRRPPGRRPSHQRQAEGTREARAARHHEALPRRHRQRGRRPHGRARRDPRPARRERRRQDDADERPLRPVQARTRARSSSTARPSASTTPATPSGPASAWSTSTSCWCPSSP